MIHKKLFATILVLLALLVPMQVSAAETETFAVLPVTINGPDKYDYLDKGVQEMLTSRLYWQDHVQSVSDDKIGSATSADVASEDDAKALLAKIGADYLIWGSVTIMGDQCSIDLQVLNKDGSNQPQSARSSLNRMIPTMDSVANTINAQVFNRPTDGGPVVQDSGETKQVNRMNPALVHNEETSDTEYYINPQFRYEGDSASEGRIRSQAMNYTSIGITVGDTDNDGNNEIYILEDAAVHVYQFNEKNQLIELDTYDSPPRFQNLNISLIDYDKDGREEIVVSSAESSKVPEPKDAKNYPRSFMLNLVNNKLEVKEKDIKLFLNVLQIPPHYERILVGTKRDPMTEMFKKGVYQVVKNGAEFELGSQIALPPFSNPYNVGYLPQADNYKIIQTDTSDRLKVFTHTGELQATSDISYSGAAHGLWIPAKIGPIERTLEMEKKYYIPMPIVPFNLDGDDRYEFLVNKPISVASTFFDRYRFYPQGEIHALYWDGVGLNLVWKTRRIKGSVVGYGIKDANNDGSLDLYVQVNTHPGATGLNTQRTYTLLYPLDTSATSAISYSQTEE